LRTVPDGQQKHPASTVGKQVWLHCDLKVRSGILNIDAQQTESIQQAIYQSSSPMDRDAVRFVG
jgi:hypothetical protein